MQHTAANGDKRTRIEMENKVDFNYHPLWIKMKEINNKRKRELFIRRNGGGEKLKGKKINMILEEDREGNG